MTYIISALFSILLCPQTKFYKSHKFHLFPLWLSHVHSECHATANTLWSQCPITQLSDVLKHPQGLELTHWPLALGDLNGILEKHFLIKFYPLMAEVSSVKLPQVIATGPHWWQVNTGSGNGLVPAVRQQIITGANADMVLCCYIVSLDNNELIIHDNNKWSLKMAAFWKWYFQLHFFQRTYFFCQIPHTQAFPYH